MSRSSFWDRGPFMGYAMPNMSQLRATLRFKAVHNKRGIQLEVTLIDSQSKRCQTHMRCSIFRIRSTRRAWPENKDFEWILDLTRLIEQSGNSIEQVLQNLQLGKAKVEAEVFHHAKTNVRRERKREQK